MRFDGFGFSALSPGLQTPARRATRSSRLTERPAFGANPGDLRMFFYAPPKLAPGAPLVVFLHGCGQSAAAYDEGAGWTALADRFGFAVLAPEQKSANNSHGCFNWFQPQDNAKGQGEAASIRQMIAHAVAARKLDPARVYITGLSAGGAMTMAMLASYPETFAGGAIIAGLPYGAAGNVFEALTSMNRVPERTAQAWGDAVRGASDHKGPWPALSVWHGDADSVVNAANGQAIVAQWRNVQGLTAKPKEEQADGKRKQVWRDADNRPVLEIHMLDGMAHGVPIAASDGLGKAGPFMLEAGISSTLHIAKFWGLTPKPAKTLLATILPGRVPPPHATAREPVLEAELLPPERQAAAAFSEAETRENKISRVINRALEIAGLIKR